MVAVSYSIFIGVISGIATSVVIWCAAKLFRDVIIPEFQAIAYQGVKIEGTWVGFYELGQTSIRQSDDDPSYTIYIKQKGHAIKGELIRNKAQNGTRDIKA